MLKEEKIIFLSQLISSQEKLIEKIGKTEKDSNNINRIFEEFSNLGEEISKTINDLIKK